MNFFWGGGGLEHGSKDVCNKFKPDKSNIFQIEFKCDKYKMTD